MIKGLTLAARRGAAQYRGGLGRPLYFVAAD
jgi:hypothetical protein